MSDDILGKSALAEIAGPLEDFAQKLGSSDGERWLWAFKRFLRKEESWSANPIWRTVVLGTHKNVKGFQKAIEVADGKMNNWTKSVMSQPQFTLAKVRVEVSLVRTTVEELGFPKGATREEIFTRAKEQGLRLCPPEVGPALRLEYMDQPPGEWLFVAMEPITASHGRQYSFLVAFDHGERWLYVNWNVSGIVRSPENIFIFAGS